MRQRTFLILAIVGVLVIAAIVLRRVGADAAPAGPPLAAGGRDSPGGAAPLKVYVHDVAPRDLAETITANGTIRASEAVELRSEITGRVVDITFAEGRRVKAGDLLVKINDSELQAQLRQTLARIDLARTQEQRQRQLVESNSTTRELLDAATNETRVLEAGADLIRAQLEKTEIRAPFDGIIGLRFVSEGTYLTSESRIATLHSVDELKIDFSISERHMDRVHAGSKVTFRVAGRPESHTGEIYAIEPAIDITTRTILLRARAPNPGQRLLPGAYAEVEVRLDQIEDALLVPTTAIVPGLNQQALFVVVEGRAQRRTVETGIRLDREIQIVRGLEPDAVVITSGLLQLRPGMPVEPIRDVAPPDPGAEAPAALTAPADES